MRYFQRYMKQIKKITPILFLALMVGAALLSYADVGNQNRYSSPNDIGSGDGDMGALIGFLLGLMVDNPGMGVPLIIIIIIVFIVYKKKHKQNISGFAGSPSPMGSGASIPPTVEPRLVADQIQAIDPNFSAEKFTAWVREVFLKLQQAWTEQNWKLIRPFESEELFSLHNTQLDEYIRAGKINVVEKIGIKSCQLASFAVDGDKEVLKVILNAVMRDYVIDAKSRKVIESDPNRDWYMTYEMTFNRKAGVKTQEGLSNKSTTNCPNCGAPTEITSAGQCEYCGSVITTGEHDWVLSDIHSL